jgi:hypothetical protein
MRVLAMSALVCALVPGLSATAEAQSLKKLRRCLEFKDMTMPRLICYDAIVPPRTKPKPGLVVGGNWRLQSSYPKRLGHLSFCYS